METIKNKNNGMYFLKRHTSCKAEMQEFQCKKQHFYSIHTEDGGHFPLPVIVVQLRRLCTHNLLFT